MEREDLKSFLEKVLTNVDFNKGTYMLKLKGEIELFLSLFNRCYKLDFNIKENKNE